MIVGLDSEFQGAQCDGRAGDTDFLCQFFERSGLDAVALADPFRGDLLRRVGRGADSVLGGYS
jgi:hypothetical protein